MNFIETGRNTKFKLDSLRFWEYCFTHLLYERNNNYLEQWCEESPFWCLHVWSRNLGIIQAGRHLWRSCGQTFTQSRCNLTEAKLEIKLGCSWNWPSWVLNVFKDGDSSLGTSPSVWTPSLWYFFSVSHAAALGFPLLQVMLPTVLWLCVSLSRVWPCLLYIHPWDSQRWQENQCFLFLIFYKADSTLRPHHGAVLPSQVQGVALVFVCQRRWNYFPRRIYHV